MPKITKQLAAVAVLIVSLLAAGIASASAPTSPYLGHAPAGLVASDNVYSSVPHARGAVLLVHGGAWVFTGPNTLLTSDAAWWQAHGFSTYDVDYRGGSDALADVVAAYDHLRSAVHVPICVMGDSAGGTMALLLAVERPSVACVITEGAVSDIATMPANFVASMDEVIPGHIESFSPVHYAARIHCPVLMAGSSVDPTVPEVPQLGEMKAARPRTQTLLLAGAPSNDWDTNFTHASVTDSALASFRSASLMLALSGVYGASDHQAR